MLNRTKLAVISFIAISAISASAIYLINRSYSPPEPLISDEEWEELRKKSREKFEAAVNSVMPDEIVGTWYFGGRYPGEFCKFYPDGRREIYRPSGSHNINDIKGTSDYRYHKDERDQPFLFVKDRYKLTDLNGKQYEMKVIKIDDSIYTFWEFGWGKFNGMKLNKEDNFVQDGKELNPVNIQEIQDVWKYGAGIK